MTRPQLSDLLVTLVCFGVLGGLLWLNSQWKKWIDRR